MGVSIFLFLPTMPAFLHKFGDKALCLVLLHSGGVSFAAYSIFDLNEQVKLTVMV